METTEKQDKKINEWFSKWKPTCSVCGGKKWIQNSTLGSYQALSADDPRKEISKHFPVVILICDTCANVLTVSAVQANIIDGENDE